MSALDNPRVVIGAPIFQKAEYLPAALDSLLSQTFGDFALVLLDDASGDESTAIAADYAARDPRVILHQNQQRLGMLANTREAFLAPRRLFPRAAYWALASDHDVWEPRWLETLVAELDAHPEAVLAYPHTRRIDERGEEIRGPWSFDTAGITDPRERFRAAFRGMVAGDMIYGLFRAEAFARVGPYRPLLVPDRLLLTELAWHGTFRQVPDVLWSRRFRGLADLERQRRAFFLGTTPLSARVPWWWAHSATLLAAYAIRGEGRPELGRLLGVRLAADYLALSGALRLRRRYGRVRKRAQRLAKRGRRAARGPLRGARRRLFGLLERRAGLRRGVASRLDYVAGVLERATREHAESGGADEKPVPEQNRRN